MRWGFNNRTNFGTYLFLLVFCSHSAPFSNLIIIPRTGRRQEKSRETNLSALTCADDVNLETEESALFRVASRQRLRACRLRFPDTPDSLATCRDMIATPPLIADKASKNGVEPDGANFRRYCRNVSSSLHQSSSKRTSPAGIRTTSSYLL